MGTGPTDTNTAAQTFDNILSDIALNKLLPIAEKIIETDAELAAPFLAVPVVKQVFEFLTNEGMSAASKALLQVLVQTGVKLIFTIQTDVERASYLASEGNLRAALLSNDPIRIAAAKQEMDNAANGIIFYDGSVNQHPE